MYLSEETLVIVSFIGIALMYVALLMTLLKWVWRWFRDHIPQLSISSVMFVGMILYGVYLIILENNTVFAAILIFGSYFFFSLELVRYVKERQLRKVVLETIAELIAEEEAEENKKPPSSKEE